MNETQFLPLSSVLLKIIPGTVLILGIFFGNVLVIVAVVTQRGLRSARNNWYVVSLAIADLLVGTIVMPMTLTFDVVGHWPFGETLCDVWLTLDVLFVTASILNLLIISLDRFWAVSSAHAVSRYRTRRAVCCLSTAVWFMALAISFPPLMGWRRLQHSGDCQLSSRIGYVLYSAMGSFYLPLAVILVIYYRIFKIARVRNKSRWAAFNRTRESLYPSQRSQNTSLEFCRRDSPMTANSRNGDARVRPGDEPGSINRALAQMVCQRARCFTAIAFKKGSRKAMSRNFTDSDRCKADSSAEAMLMLRKKALLRKQERRSMAVLGMILLVFIGCWLPFFVLYVLRAICCELPGKTGAIVFNVIFWLGYCNSAVNPVIYAALNPEFRKAFKRILCGRRYKRIRQSAGNTVNTNLHALTKASDGAAV